MTETSLSKLQKQIDKLQKENLKLRDLLEERKEKQHNAEMSLKYYQENLERIVEQAIKKATSQIMDELEKVKKENLHLKNLLNISSENSGIPRSKTAISKNKRIPNSRERSNKLKGGQTGHPKHKLERFKDDEITDTIIHEVARCTCGCEELEDLGLRTTKDLFDIDIRIIKARNEFHNYKCKNCGKVIESPIPLNLKEENQYGSNAQALALSLVNEGYVSFKRVRELICGFTGGEMNMSEGFIAKLQKRSYQKLENFDNELYKNLLTLKVLNWDDTVISIDKTQACLRYYGNEEFAYYKAHNKKDKDGLDEDNILNLLPKETVVVHDHNKVNYNDDYEFTKCRIFCED